MAKLSKEIRDYFSKLGKMGSKESKSAGAKKLAESMTPAQRKARAVKASKAALKARKAKAKK